MAKVKKPDDVVALSIRLLDALGTQRSLGKEVYPPSLRRLAELCDVAPEDDRIFKAIAKKPFTDKATAKVMGKPGLDSSVYFKEDVPTKAELARIAVAELASRMLRVLESQRELGGDAYPPTWSRLVELCDLNVSNKLVSKTLADETMAREATIANAGKPDRDAPIILTRDLAGGARGWGSALIDFAFAKSHKAGILAFTAKQLAKKVQPSLRRAFEEDLVARLGRDDMPDPYAWLPNKQPLIFRRADIRPGEPFRVGDVEPAPVAEATAPAVTGVGPPPARDFAGAFREAFERIDVGNRRTNNVRLLDLRHDLADFGREQFDAGLRGLREQREFSLDSHEGLLKPLTPEEREAGITEMGSLLVYVSRR